MLNLKDFSDVINYYLPEPHASLLNGMLFGYSIKTSGELYNQLKIVGLLHLVVLSGTNISILTSLISDSTRFMGKYLSLFISITAIILFIFFVGAEAPIVRAGIMGVLSLVAILYGRKTLSLYLLLITGIVSITIWPEWLGTISFQLSYAATLGLIIFAPALPSVNTTENSTYNKLVHYIKRELKITLSAQIFTVPIIFFYFKQVSFISPLSNIMVSWTIAPIMVFGMLTALLGKIHFLLGLAPSYISFILIQYMIIIIDICSHIPFASVQF